MKPKVPYLTEEEDRAITQAALSDPDAQPLTDAELAQMKRGRGRQVDPVKVRIGIRLDHDLVKAMRAEGKGWQTRANALLRKGMGL